MSVQLNAGTGGSVLAADTVSGEEHQLTKIEFGTTGNATPVSTANPLPVVQTGTPGLPTGAATETTLAAAAASLAVMDDWDETNRCAVNPISGQAGVAAGAGAVGATVQRVTLASDDPGVSSLASLDAKTVTARTADYDSGAGTVTTQFMGIALPASGGPVAGGTSTNPLRVDPTGTTTQPTNDGGTSFTIDTPQLPAALGQATMANSLPVVIASNQGNIGVTDGGTSLTIDSPQLPATLGQTTMANGLPVTLASDQSSIPVAATLQTGSNVIGALTANQSVNMAQINGVAPSMGNGASGTGVQRVTIANDSTGVVGLAAGSNTIGSLAANQSVNTAQINGVAPSMGNGASGTGVQRVTIANDSTGQVTLAAGTASVGNVGLATRTSGGCSMSRTLSAASTNATNVKASAGQVYGMILTNVNAAARFLKMYNSASAPTAGSGTPVMTIQIPGNTAGAGLVLDFPMGLSFSSGIGFTITTGVADSDTGAVAANEIILNLFYA